jgi:hypothetical protein
MSAPFSPSSLAEFESCPRKWAWRKIHGIVSLSSPAQAFGLRLHRHLELYLRDGVPIDQTDDAGKAAFAGLHLLPRPGTALIETPMALEYGGQKFHGIPDVMAHGAETADLRTTRPAVFDHKSTVDFKWAKTPEALRTDLQLALYAYAAMLRYGVPECHCRWNYYRRNKPFKAIPVDVIVTFDDIRPTLDRAVSLAERMAYVIRHGYRALSLPPHVNHCGAFNGCAHQTRCTDLTPEKRMISLMSNAAPDAAAFFAALEAQKGGPPPAGPPPAGPPPAPVYQAHPQDPNFVWVNGAWTHVSQLPPPGAPPPAAAPPVAINPPPVQGAPVQGLSVSAAHAQPAPMVTVVHNAPPAGVAPVAAEAAPAKKPRGRPRKNPQPVAGAPVTATAPDGDDFWPTVAGMLRAAADYLDGE